MPHPRSTPPAAGRMVRGARRRRSAWHGESLEPRRLLDGVDASSAVPLTWLANDTSNLLGRIDQPGEVDLYRFTTAQPAKLSLQARARTADPLDGRVQLLAVGDSQSGAHVVAADQLSLGDNAAVDGWIAPGDYLVAVAADAATSQQALDEALGGYDLSLKLDREAYQAFAATAGAPIAASDSVFTSQSNSTNNSTAAPLIAAPVLFAGNGNSTVFRNFNPPAASPTTNGTGSVSAPPSPVIQSGSPNAVPSSSPAASTPASSAIAITSANFPAAAAPVSRLSGAGAAASLPSLGRAVASTPSASPAVPNRVSSLATAADGSDSSQEGMLEYSFRRTGEVLTRAIGGTMRQVRDAALVGLGEAVRFDLLGGDEEDWFADALHVILPAAPGGAVLDAALEAIQSQPMPVAKPHDETRVEAAKSQSDISAAAAGLAALVFARPINRRKPARAAYKKTSAHRSR